MNKIINKIKMEYSKITCKNTVSVLIGTMFGSTLSYMLFGSNIFDLFVISSVLVALTLIIEDSGFFK